jgi:hypothetical protein
METGQLNILTFTANLVIASVSAALFIYVMRRKETPPVDSRLLEMVDRLQARVDTLELRVMQLQAWASSLSSQVVGLGGQPVSFAEIQQTQNGAVHQMAEDSARLLRILKDSYSVDELETVALELGAKDGTLGTGNVDARAAKLVRYAQNHNKLNELAFCIWRDRPDARTN